MLLKALIELLIRPSLANSLDAALSTIWPSFPRVACTPEGDALKAASNLAASNFKLPSLALVNPIFRSSLTLEKSAVMARVMPRLMVLTPLVSAAAVRVEVTMLLKSLMNAVSAFLASSGELESFKRVRPMAEVWAAATAALNLPNVDRLAVAVVSCACSLAVDLLMLAVIGLVAAVAAAWVVVWLVALVVALGVRFPNIWLMFMAFCFKSWPCGPTACHRRPGGYMVERLPHKLKSDKRCFAAPSRA